MADFVPPTNANGALEPGALYANIKGWNDPPKHVFSPNSSGRKRIDPRKRVAHDLTSGAGFQPVQPAAFNPHTNNVQPVPGYISPNYTNNPTPPIQPIPGTLPHATSNPDISSHIASPVPVDQHSNSMPYLPRDEPKPIINNPPVVPIYNGCSMPSAPQPTVLQPVQTINSFPSPPSSIPSPPPSSISSPPSSIPFMTEKSQDGRKLSAPTNAKMNAPINGGNSIHNSIFSQMATPTMLQSSHMTSKSSTESNQGNGFTSISQSNSITESVSNTQAPSANINLVIPPPIQNQLRSSPKSLSPVPVVPPTNGFYVAKVTNGSNHSPQNGSPQNSSTNSPIPTHDKIIMPNDSELLTEVTEKLLDVCNKCSCVITKKISDDINKKIEVFKTSWTSGKLSQNVKVQMSNLSQALDKREFNQADSIHKSLIVSHSSEVMSWMIGIKKLIISYQKVVEDNNKY